MWATYVRLVIFVVVIAQFGCASTTTAGSRETSAAHQMQGTDYADEWVGTWTGHGDVYSATENMWLKNRPVFVKVTRTGWNEVEVNVAVTGSQPDRFIVRTTLNSTPKIEGLWDPTQSSPLGRADGPPRTGRVEFTLERQAETLSGMLEVRSQPDENSPFEVSGGCRFVCEPGEAEGIWW